MTSTPTATRAFLRDLSLILGVPLVLTTALLAWWRPWGKVMAPYEAPSGTDVFAAVTGTWDWSAAEGFCHKNPHTISFSPDRRAMTLRSPEPYTDSAGVQHWATVYDIREHTRGRIRGLIRGETRHTPTGEPVVWDLILVDANTYRWHRTDWAWGALTPPVRRVRGPRRRRSNPIPERRSSLDVRLATCRQLRALTPDDDLLRQALEVGGARVRAVPWDEIDPRAAGLVCLRSTWDYHRRWPEFRRWIAGFGSGPARLWNPAETLAWNADKAYLRELAAAGVTVPATRWYEPGERPDCEAFLRAAGVSRAVLKPRISATAFATHVVDPGTRLTEAEWQPLEVAGSLLQSFVPEIGEGEASLVFLDGDFSHAVHKRPAPGEFRVQRDFGGRVTVHEPSTALRGFAERVLEAAPCPWVYARVDAVETSRGPTLMELELIEPDLFLATRPDAAQRLARALLARAGGAAA